MCKEGKKRVEIQMFRRGMSASRLEKPAELYLGRISSEEPKKSSNRTIRVLVVVARPTLFGLGLPASGA